MINKDSLRQYSAKEWKWIIRIILREMKCVTEDMTLQVMVAVQASGLRVHPKVLLGLIALDFPALSNACGRNHERERHHVQHVLNFDSASQNRRISIGCRAFNTNL